MMGCDFSKLTVEDIEFIQIDTFQLLSNSSLGFLCCVLFNLLLICVLFNLLLIIFNFLILHFFMG
jgi:hypothetical protein